ncbi:MAG: hypothetical protein Q9219_006750 [cf. Caloplaca sp. 3 TL-2023]
MAPLLILFLFGAIVNYTLTCLSLDYEKLNDASDDDYKSARHDRDPIRTAGSRMPILRSTLTFLFHGRALFEHISRSKPTVTRIRLLNSDLYTIHGAQNIAAALRSPSLSVSPAYGFALQHCFGMAGRAAQAYFRDTSGSRAKPIKGSAVLQPHDRVMHLTHENLSRGLLAPDGLAEVSSRFERYLTQALEALNVGEEDWVEEGDLLEFFEKIVGTALLQAIFGAELLRLNSSFVRDLWAFDRMVMGLAKRLPFVWIPRAYWLRRKLLQGVKKWHAVAEASSIIAALDEGDERYTEEAEGEASDVWGTRMVRERYDMLLDVADQDRNSVAATDLGFIWAAVTNVIPSSMALTLHICRDPSLHSSLCNDLVCMLEKQSISPIPTTPPHPKLPLQKLESHPLLLSLYAETLRFGVQIHIPRTSPHQPLGLGMRHNAVVPARQLLLLNTWVAHMDVRAWNTISPQTRPLEHFWAQRFLIDPKDSTSGPAKAKGRNEERGEGSTEKKAEKASSSCYFSTAGLEGAWIPFGGRLLAKRIMLLSCGLLITTFEVEILANDEAMEFASERFGFGVRKPKGRIPFRFRKRKGI